jgi:hypothetical protein
MWEMGIYARKYTGNSASGRPRAEQLAQILRNESPECAGQVCLVFLKSTVCGFFNYEVNNLTLPVITNIAAGLPYSNDKIDLLLKIKPCILDAE